MQGYHLAIFDEVFFDSPLEAWMYGPVCPEVYHRFKESKNLGLSLDPAEQKEVFFNEDLEDMFR